MGWSLLELYDDTLCIMAISTVTWAVKPSSWRQWNTLRITVRITQWKVQPERRKNFSFKACEITSLFIFNHSQKTDWRRNQIEFYDFITFTSLFNALHYYSLFKGSLWHYRVLKEQSGKSKLWEPITRKWDYKTLLPYQDWVKIDLERSVCLHNIHCW